jgi:hypothetical protein
MVVTSRMPLYVVMSLMALMSLYGCSVDCEAAAKGTQSCLEATPGSDSGTAAPGRMLGDDYSADAEGRSLTDTVADACKQLQMQLNCFETDEGNVCGCTCAETKSDDCGEGNDDKTMKEVAVDPIMTMAKELCTGDNAVTSKCD